MPSVIIISYKDSTPDGSLVINTTSRSSETWSKELSPFFLGPCKLYDNYVSQTMENGWQFSKVYPEFVDSKGNPTDRYFEWAKAGWESKWASRYPMGKGTIPLYSFWDGQKYGYVEARNKIYIPLYRDAVKDTIAFQKLKELYYSNKEIYLRDFDGWNHKVAHLSYEEVFNNPFRKCGHAFVLGAMLEKYI